MKKFASLILAFSTLLLTACGGGDDSEEVTEGPTLVRPDRPQHIPTNNWWQVPLPDLAPDPDRPEIRLIGDRYVELNVGEQYTEVGATAVDAQDGDISSSVSIDVSQLDTSEEGTYIVRYNVMDSEQKEAVEAVRFVRVNGALPRPLAMRPIGSTLSHMGYLEYLPPDFSADADETYPLLIYIQGSGGNAESSGPSPLTSLNQAILVGGPPQMIHGGHWDESLPFIVLSPQFGSSDDFTVAEQIDSFIEFAYATYPIDRDRVYFSGWSQGAFISLIYAYNFPSKVAALVSIGTGLSDPDIAPDDFCNIENVPIWLFHGDDDPVIPVSYSINVYDVIEQRCQPQTAPRMTLFNGVNHFSHEGVFNLIFMEGGSSGVTADPAFDLYDQTVYEWLLSHRISDRD